ncbi:MAG: hypothetical protein QM831_36305 [Kofleriaceae bacterium]
MRFRTLIALLIASCQVDNHDDHPKQPHPDLAQQILEGERRMHERYASSRQIVYAIANSNLADAQDNARVIDGLVDPDLLPVWQPYIVDVQASARGIVNATNLGSAAHQFASMGGRCAACHTAMATKIKFDDSLPAIENRTPGMLDHVQSAMSMWDGLVGPDDAHWTAGATALGTMPVNLIAREATPSFVGDVDDTARIRALAARATAARYQDERVEVFADVMTTCAHCHQLLRDR